MRDHKKAGEKLRDFVWKHWSTHTRGHIDMIVYTLEGDPFIRHLYIEPNLAGMWQVTSEWDSYCCALYALQKPKRKRVHDRGINIYTAVQRLEAEFRSNQFPSKLGPDIRPDEQRPADKYVIQLKATPSERTDLML
jgi:hypothetical protein